MLAKKPAPEGSLKLVENLVFWILREKFCVFFEKNSITEAVDKAGVFSKSF
jgi:hypothetical protein